MVTCYTPATLADALALLSQHALIPYAGGTDLMVAEVPDRAFLFIHALPELRAITEDAEYIRFGAAVTFTEVLESPLAPAVLKEAVSQIAAPAIRNTGTLGGNIGNGSAKADSALVFFAADALLRLASTAGERLVPIAAFYKGRKKLDLAPGELIVEILFPKAHNVRHYYHKIGARKALAISRLAFVGLMNIDAGVVRHNAIALGAITDVAIRRPDIDAMLVGKTVDEAKALKPAYLAAYSEAIVPIRGRISAEYRKSVALALLNDYLETMGI